MLNINATNFRKDIFNILDQIIEYNEPVHISTKTGNAILLSEEEYNGLIETLYLSSIPQVKNDIINGINTPIEECISEDEVEW